MGMYDTIIDEQVKCFWVPIYDKGSYWTSGGQCRYFGVGDCVPYKTWYYDYTPNFNILDYTSGWNMDSQCLHIIRDGKVVETIELCDVEDTEFVGMEKFINRFGEEFNINSVISLRDYLTKSAKYKELCDEAHTESKKLWEEISALSHGVIHKSQEEKDKCIELMSKYHQIKKEEDKKLVQIYDELLKDYENVSDTDQDVYDFGAFLDCLKNWTEIVQYDSNNEEVKEDSRLYELTQNRLHDLLELANKVKTLASDKVLLERFLSYSGLIEYDILDTIRLAERAWRDSPNNHVCEKCGYHEHYGCSKFHGEKPGVEKLCEKEISDECGNN